MTDLSREARALLDLARGEDLPSAEDRARVRRALAAGLAAGVASNAAPAAAAAGKSALAAGASSFATKTGAVWLVVGAVAGLAGTVTMLATMPGHDTHDGASGPKTAPVTRQDSTSHVATGAPAPAVTTTPVVASETKDAVEPAAVPGPPAKAAVTRSQARTVVDTTHSTAVVDAPTTAVAPAPSSVATMSDLPPESAAAVPAPSSLGAETALLESARAALGRGDARGALSLLDAHEHRFPSGALTEERLAAKVFALCGLGRRSEAATVAARLLQLSPASPLRARVLDSCAYRP